jgi:uncharacterized protein (DUF342 family)
MQDSWHRTFMIFYIYESAIAELITQSETLIASGIKPTTGKDSKFESLVSDQIYSAPKIDEHGKANYHDINEFVIAESGAKLMRRSLPGKGKSGTDIFGKTR